MNEVVWSMDLPSPEDPGVAEFIAAWALERAEYVTYEDVGARYDRDFCHVSVKHAVLHGGGKRIYGWALWKFTSGEQVQIWGDFHSVWEKPDGSIVDVTPPKDGGSKTLFVRDPGKVIESLQGFQFLYNNRMSTGEFREALTGAPTSDERYAFPSSAKLLTEYCKKLGLPDTSMQ